MEVSGRDIKQMTIDEIKQELRYLDPGPDLSLYFGAGGESDEYRSVRADNRRTVLRNELNRRK